MNPVFAWQKTAKQIPILVEKNMKMKIGQKKIGYSKFEKMDFWFIYLLIAFPILQFIVFWIYVNASSIALSFQTPQGEFTLKNIQAVFKAFDGIDTYEIILR